MRDTLTIRVIWWHQGPSGEMRADLQSQFFTTPNRLISHLNHTLANVIFLQGISPHLLVWLGFIWVKYLESLMIEI